jgi:shikimate kinase
MQHTVFLIGFMGAGKTTFGKKLAVKLEVPFIDIDVAVCKHSNVPTVKTLIEQKGFEYFREAENDTLKSINLQKPIVVATGGGTPCYFDNMQYMKQNGIVVYMDMDEKSIFNRLKQTNLAERPLLSNLDDDSLREFIAEKLQERLPFYQQAHITFNTLHGNLDDLAEELKGFLFSF